MASDMEGRTRVRAVRPEIDAGTLLPGAQFIDAHSVMVGDAPLNARLGLPHGDPAIPQDHRAILGAEGFRGDSGPIMTAETTPLLQAKDYSAPSVFLPENLLREARRQKSLASENVPEICVLDPDGDIVRQLRAAGRATRSESWACYHTDLDIVDHGNQRFGIVGCAVGASFAVLVAEQLFASGCKLLISITSSGLYKRAATAF